MDPTSGSESLERLRTLAQEHRVHFDVAPEQEVVRGQPTRVGYRVRLWGSHGRLHGAMPGCPDCRDVQAALVTLAEWLIGAEPCATPSDVEPETGALYPAVTAGASDEVLVTLRMLHRHDDASGVDEAEQSPCLARRRRRLAELGIPEQG